MYVGQVKSSTSKKFGLTLERVLLTSHALPKKLCSFRHSFFFGRHKGAACPQHHCSFIEGFSTFCYDSLAESLCRMKVLSVKQILQLRSNSLYSSSADITEIVKINLGSRGFLLFGVFLIAAIPKEKGFDSLYDFLIKVFNLQVILKVILHFRCRLFYRK